MTKEDNIFFAKRKLIDNLYKSANLEGIAVTFADTVAFVNNVNTGKISVDDMLKLKGLKDAWEYVLNTIDEELTIDYIKKIHFEVCKGQNIEPLGNFRDRGVGITGTSYRPKLPSECNYDKELNDIMKVEDSLDKSITLFLWIQRSQMFLDGNKRTAVIFANHYLISHGKGIIVIPAELVSEYKKLLIDYYEGKNEDIKEFLYNKCLTKI